MGEWQLIAAGIGIGIMVAAPIGPINLMAIRSTLSSGFWSGVFTGVGAVLGDGTFAIVAAFGLTAVSSFIMVHATWIYIAGGLIMFSVGIRTIVAKVDDTALEAPGTSARSLALVGGTYLLTVTNPATMIAFIAIFGGVSDLVSEPGDYVGASLMVAAVMAGSLIWWLFLSWIASLFKARMSGGWLKYINWGSGAVIAAFGLGVLLRAVAGWGGA